MAWEDVYFSWDKLTLQADAIKFMAPLLARMPSGDLFLRGGPILTPTGLTNISTSMGRVMAPGMETPHMVEWNGVDGFVVQPNAGAGLPSLLIQMIFHIVSLANVAGTCHRIATIRRNGGNDIQTILDEPIVRPYDSPHRREFALRVLPGDLIQLYTECQNSDVADGVDGVGIFFLCT